MMLRAHQTPSTGELKMRNMTLVNIRIAVIKRYKKDLLKVTDIVVANTFFSIRPFVNKNQSVRFARLDFSRLAILRAYIMCIRDLVPISLDVPRHLGKINYEKTDLTRMAELHIEGLEGTAYTLIAYSKALKPESSSCHLGYANGKHKLFFSTKTSMSVRESGTYRSRFQISFLFSRCKAIYWSYALQDETQDQLDFSYNASFTSQNVAEVMMKEDEM